MSGSIAFFECRLGDALEISVKVDGRFTAVITHPCVGAGWFLRSLSTNKRFRSRVAAEAAAMALALQQEDCR